MQTGGANPKKKERLTNRSERVMKRAVKNWEFARDVHNSGTTNRGELAQGEAMQDKAQRQGERAKKIRAKAEKYQTGGVLKKIGSKIGKKLRPIKNERPKIYDPKKLEQLRNAVASKNSGKYQVGGATNAGTDSIKAKAAAAAKAKAMKAMKTTASKAGKTSTDAAKKYMIGGMVNPNSNVSKQTVPGSRGVKSGVNPSAAASKVARGTVGGTSTAPSTAVPKAQMGGMQGRSISERAANRKVSKGKGMISYRVGDKTVPGSPENKGEYIGFSRDARKDNKSGKTIGIRMSDAKPARKIRQTGGVSDISPYSPNYKPHGEPKAGGAKLKKPKAFNRGAVRKFHKMIKKS